MIWAGFGLSGLVAGLCAGVDLASLTFANRDDGDHQALLLDPVDQAITGGAQFDLVVFGHAVQGVGGDAGQFQALA